MLSSYGKRRSTQRSSSAIAPGSVNSSAPSSPQFGADDGGTGGGGGTGGPSDDGDRPTIRSSKKSAAGVARSRSPFDDRVKSVRSRIQEMVAAAGEESSDGSEVFDNNAETSKPVRGAKAASQNRKNSVMEEPSVDAPRMSTPSGRKPGSLSGRTSEAVTVVHPISESSQKVVGQHGAAFVGARVRISDPRIARYVEPTGTIVEVRCNGERVRVEHDGADNAQRYYNTGKNEEYQLVFEADAGSGLPAVPAVPERSSALIPRTFGSQRLPAPPIVADSSSSSPADSPRASSVATVPSRSSKAAAKKAGRCGSKVQRRSLSEPPEIAPDTQPEIAEAKVAMKKSRYSQIRQTRKSSIASAVEAPLDPVAGTSSAPENSSIPEAPVKSSYSQRRSLRMSKTQSVSTDTEAAAATCATTSSMAAGASDFAGGASSSSSHNPNLLPASKAASSSSSHNPNLHPASKPAVGDTDRDAQFEQLRHDHDMLLKRLSSMEQTFVQNLGAVKDDVNLQIETTEKRIFTRLRSDVLEELDKRMRQSMATSSGQPTSAEASKIYGNKLGVDVTPSYDPVPQTVGTPINEEPEGEYDTNDPSESSSIQASGSRRGSEFWRSPSIEETPPQKQSKKDKSSVEVSSADLADNRRRLQNISNAARSITSSLGGNPVEPVSYTTPAKLDYSGAQTPDFSAPSFSGSLSFAGSPAPLASTPGDSPDGLDAEMARLADLRRFASSVLKAAESQCQQALPNPGAHESAAWSDVPRGRMSAGAFGTDSHPSGLRGVANHQERQDPSSASAGLEHFPNPFQQASSSSSGGRRRTVSTPGHVPPACPWEEPRRSLTPRGTKLPAQQAPQPPPMQAMPRARRSAAQPKHAPWPPAGGSGDWEGNVEIEGRLVF